MWKRLNYTDLTEILAQDEIDKLDVYSLSADISSICQKQLDSVADMFRGSWSAKGYALDVREHYVAPEYRIPVLNYARWQIWTRFPNSKDIGLDEPRKAAYEEAKELLKSPYIGTSTPDYSDDPVLSVDSTLSAANDAAIAMPYMTINDPWIGF
jgi:hypothetical protein